MKTGRLLKFQRPGAEIHAYIYQDEGVFKGAIFARGGNASESHAPLHELSAASLQAVEAAVRAFVDARFPRAGGTS